MAVGWPQQHVKSKKIVKQCHNRSKTVEISQDADSDGLKSRHQKSGVFLNKLQVDIWSYLSQYLEFRAKPRLYIYYQDIPRATLVFLVDIAASRPPF